MYIGDVKAENRERHPCAAVILILEFFDTGAQRHAHVIINISFVKSSIARYKQYRDDID